MNTDSIDMRPHLLDKSSGKYLLLDSGAAVSAIPPDPGDLPDPKMCLKAVNGTRLKSYRFKDLDIKIGRKSYKIRAVKTDVKYPILGYDFNKKHKMELGWSNFGDAVLRDKVSQNETVLKYKGLPREEAEGFSSLHLVPIDPSNDRSKWSADQEESFRTFGRKKTIGDLHRPGVTGDQAEKMFFELASMEALEKEAEEIINNIEAMPEGEFKELIKKYPAVLEMDFKTEDPKNGIIHRIHTGEEPPCTAKVRRILPGSPKAIKGQQAIKELERLGIIERVKPGEPNNWSSPGHFTLKSDGWFIEMRWRLSTTQ